MSDQYISMRGIVLQSRGYGNFLVKCENMETNVSCTLCGKIRNNSIKIMEGDEVLVDVSAYDPSKGRITYRSKSKRK